MALALPPPNVPDLQSDNSIDLDQLGNADLQTYVGYPGIKDGDRFWTRWWGCGAQGEAVDYADTLVEVEDAEMEPGKGMPVKVGNGLLKALDQGWVFYSYVMEDTTQPDLRGEESLRRFFYVGKRSASTTSLAAPQCRESHALKLDPDVLDQVDTLLFVTLPYTAMQAGDKVILQLDMYFGENDPWDPTFVSQTVTEAQVGQPLQWQIESVPFKFIEGGFALLSYSIDYLDPTSRTESAVQRVDVIKPSAALLPPPSIKDFSGGDLDPELYQGGITVQVELYPGIQVGDDVVLHASADTRIVKNLRVDPSTIASRVLHFALDHAWLSASNGKTMELVYQFARVGVAGTSQPLSVMLRKPLHLPFPEVEGVTMEDQDSGYIFAAQVTSSVIVRVPDEAVIGADDIVRMHWEGAGSTGSHIADPSAGDSKRFLIPRSAVPANMGKRVSVYYRVTAAGEPPAASLAFDLEVKPITSGWPTIQFTEPRAANGQLSLALVPPSGAKLELGHWSFIAPGQLVRVKAIGLAIGDEEETENIRVGAAEAVTEGEYDAGKLLLSLSRVFLSRLQLGQYFRITVETSFDDGADYRAFPIVDLRLVQ